jgi:hypothetical protein
MNPNDKMIVAIVIAIILIFTIVFAVKENFKINSMDEETTKDTTTFDTSCSGGMGDAYFSWQKWSFDDGRDDNSHDKRFWF